MPFTFHHTGISGVVLVKPQHFSDQRGWFMELIKSSAYQAEGVPAHFAQSNVSFSKANVLRGLHYQLPPHEQGKLVTVLSGIVWDVAVDLRTDSPTHGAWVAYELSSENHWLLYIPPGFAHGFVALAEDTVVHYSCTKEYDKASERGVRGDDPDLAIPWPVEDPIVSDKDAALPFLAELVAEELA
jgi:dTDP-4-dehydrorhamnose 3,5-epimerase